MTSDGSGAGERSPRPAVVISALVVAVLTLLVVGAVAWQLSGAGDEPGATPSPAARSPGRSVSPSAPVSPEALPPLGRPRDVATDLAVPWGVAFLPDGSALVSERPTGRVVQVAEGRSARTVDTVPGVVPDGEGGLLGIAVSPEFAADHLVYAYFSTATDNRISAMRLTDRGLVHARVLLDGIPRATYHDGGRLLFGPDGMLYASTGDHGDPHLAQDLDSLAGKILRLRPDGTIPRGNPFGHSPVWSYGHRNVQGLAFDDAGRLWATELGDAATDELNLIRPGGNYGWPLVDGDGGPAATHRGLTNPELTWPVDQASPSGLAYRDGVLYMGALRGERLWQIPLRGGHAQHPSAALDGVLGRLRTVAVAPDGDLWITTSNTDGRATEVSAGDDRVVSLSAG